MPPVGQPGQVAAALTRAATGADPGRAAAARLSVLAAALGLGPGPGPAGRPADPTVGPAGAEVLRNRFGESPAEQVAYLLFELGADDAAIADVIGDAAAAYEPGGFSADWARVCRHAELSGAGGELLSRARALAGAVPDAEAAQRRVVRLTSNRRR